MGYKEVTVGLLAGRLLLFVAGLDEEADNADDQDTKLNQIRICNHTSQPPFL